MSSSLRSTPQQPWSIEVVMNSKKSWTSCLIKCLLTNICGEQIRQLIRHLKKISAWNDSYRRDGWLRVAKLQDSSRVLLYFLFSFPKFIRRVTPIWKYHRRIFLSSSYRKFFSTWKNFLLLEQFSDLVRSTGIFISYSYSLFTYFDCVFKNSNYPNFLSHFLFRVASHER